MLLLELLLLLLMERSVVAVFHLYVAHTLCDPSSSSVCQIVPSVAEREMPLLDETEDHVVAMIKNDAALFGRCGVGIRLVWPTVQAICDDHTLSSLLPPCRVGLVKPAK